MLSEYSSILHRKASWIGDLMLAISLTELMSRIYKELKKVECPQDQTTQSIDRLMKWRGSSQEMS